MDGCDASQAAELARALRHRVHEMTHQLVRLERQHVTGTNSRASAIRCEAAELRRDINEAQSLIDRTTAPLPEQPDTTKAKPVAKDRR
jgi:hypothetical protein